MYFLFLFLFQGIICLLSPIQRKRIPLPVHGLVSFRTPNTTAVVNALLSYLNGRKRNAGANFRAGCFVVSIHHREQKLSECRAAGEHGSHRVSLETDDARKGTSRTCFFLSFPNLCRAEQVWQACHQLLRLFRNAAPSEV